MKIITYGKLGGEIIFNLCLRHCEYVESKEKDGKKSETENESDKKKKETKFDEASGAVTPLRILFPVLLVDMSGEELRPAHLHLHTHSDKPNMRVCYIENSQQLPSKASTHRAATPMVFTFAEENDTENGESFSSLLLNQSYDLVFYEDDIKGFR